LFGAAVVAEIAVAPAATVAAEIVSMVAAEVFAEVVAVAQQKKKAALVQRVSVGERGAFRAQPRE
jgi:hypothetical protein